MQSPREWVLSFFTAVAIIPYCPLQPQKNFFDPSEEKETMKIEIQLDANQMQ